MKTKPSSEKALRREVLGAVARYYKATAGKKDFKPGDRIPYGGRIYDGREMTSLAGACLDFWLTAGPYAAQFERGLAQYIGVKHCSLVNSGSSANLVAFAALTSPKLGARRIKRGDEVITTASCFPTTLAPVIQSGAVPVFVDVEPGTYNASFEAVERAVTGKTKAVVLAHTLGNPFDAPRLRQFCDKKGLWLIEDNCDALGSVINTSAGPRKTGSFGHLATASFYPAHHITTGEGGAVFTSDPMLKRLADSFRDWGRDCWCAAGTDNTCKARFTGQFGLLPKGYDHKYVYSHFGYNLKMTDLQAAIGCAQLKKLPAFVRARRKNFDYLRDGLSGLADALVLPRACRETEPSWFGFPIAVRSDAGFTRNELVTHLEGLGIQTRMLFAGNILLHPCFDGLRGDKSVYRISGSLEQTDAVVTDVFWLGVYPGLGRKQLDFIISAVREFAAKHR
ncbi:MAG: lipopolysaccharide biosynthesis protein RfbH [Elusimicrobiaceae bacterium]|nr:lipopolysaccharide biosynthesis protein RfbH [Elusimicrobiaceae bacterium]